MIPNWNKILKEWSYRVGVIKPNNSRHIYQLNKILEERGWPNEIINQFIQNLNEIAPTDMVSNPNPKGRADKVQYQYAKQWLDDNPDAETSDDFKKDVGKEKDTKKKKKTSKEINKSDRQFRFKRGWKKGAPGNAGSMLNEEGSNHISERMFEEDLTEEESVKILLENIKGTELEKQNQSESIAGDLKVGDLPSDTPKEKRGIVSKTILAVRNGKRKSDKAKKHSKKYGWENTELMNFGGEQSDKDKQKEFLKGKKIVSFKNGKKVEIPLDKAQELIQTAGGGKNPSDTSSLLVDKDSNEVTILFHSDKDSRTAQTGNSTPREELTGKSTQRELNKLVKNDVISQKQADEILDIREAYAKRIDDIEDEFKTRATNVSKVALKRLDSGDVDAKDIIDNFKKTSGSKEADKYWKKRVIGQYSEDVLNQTNKKGEPTSKAKNAKRWLEDSNPNGYDTPPTEEQMLRAYLKRNSEEVPTGEDKAILGRLNSGEDTPKRQKAGTVVKGFDFTPDSAKEIEEIRTRALEMELQQVEELNETKVNVDGKDIGMGSYLASENVWDFAHMDMLTQTEGTVHEYDDMFEVNMSGHYLNKEVLAKSLGVSTKTDFQKRFYVGDLVGQEDADGNLTGAGKIIYFMRGEEKSDDDIAFQEKKIRTKQGPESKASTVYNNGSDLKELIDRFGKS